MVGQFLRGGIRAVPAGPAVVEAAADATRAWSALSDSSADSAVSAADPRVSSRASWTQRAPATRSACGDGSSAEVHISSGDDLQMSAADLLRHLSGARWRKLIGSGHAVVAATERAGQRSVIFTEVGSEPVAITRIRVFSEAG